MNAGDDPQTASQIWTSPRYNDAALKYTSADQQQAAVRRRLLVQLRGIRHHQPGRHQPGPRARPQWYAGASRRDQTLVTLRSGLANWGGRYPDRFNTQASMSYVTGAHNAKIGFQYNWGTYINTRETNADLQQVYSNGVPSSVTVYNTPLRYKDALLGDLGIYAQDTWTHQSPDAERRPPLRDAEARSVEAGVGRRPLHRRAQFRSDSDADLEGHCAAVRRWSTTCSAMPRRR